MTRTSPHQVLRTIVMLALFVLAAPSLAFEITGRVINATTGEPLHPATIRVLNPSGGMMVEKEVETLDSDGHFVVEELKNDAPVYLLRVDYKGANYTEMVRPNGSFVSIDLAVYEPTLSWDHVHVSMPHVIVSRSADTLYVEKFIQIENHSSPAKTVTGPGAEFTFYLPDDMFTTPTMQVRALGMPLPMAPRGTDEPGFYTMDYPIRPGLTQVNMSLALPYSGGQYRYIEKFKYPVQEMMIIAEDPGLRLTSATNTVEQADDFHGFNAYRITGLGPDMPLQLSIEGGSSATRMPSSAQPQIFVVQSEAFTVSIVMMILLAMALLIVLAAVAQRAPSAEEERKVLEAQKDDLLGQLARLDDLHKTGTVSDAIYKMKRTELVNSLAHLYYRLQYEEKPAPAERRAEDTARV